MNRGGIGKNERYFVKRRDRSRYCSSIFNQDIVYAAQIERVDNNKDSKKKKGVKKKYKRRIGFVSGIGEE